MIIYVGCKIYSSQATLLTLTTTRSMLLLKRFLVIKILSVWNDFSLKRHINSRTAVPPAL